MADIQRYERILKKSSGTTAKLLMLLLYTAVLGAWTVLAFITAFHPSILILAVLTLVALILPTWKYTSVEYEYSFVAGNFTLSKIYGKRRIKQVFESELKMLISAQPLDTAKMPDKEDVRIIDGLPDGAEFPVLCVFQDGDENKYYVLMDCDAVTARILKFFRMSTLDREIIKRASAND